MPSESYEKVLIVQGNDFTINDKKNMVKNLALVMTCRQIPITITNNIQVLIFSCHSSEWISKFHIPSKCYENIDFVQWNDYATKTGKI